MKHPEERHFHSSEGEIGRRCCHSNVDPYVASRHLLHFLAELSGCFSTPCKDTNHVSEVGSPVYLINRLVEAPEMDNVSNRAEDLFLGYLHLWRDVIKDCCLGLSHCRIAPLGHTSFHSNHLRTLSCIICVIC